MTLSKTEIVLNALAKKYPDHKISVTDGKIVFWEGEKRQPGDVELEELYQAEVSALAKVAYKERRKAEYPPVLDFVDAQVKKLSGDPVLAEEGRAQEAAYVQASLAVKAKYPKPEKA